MNDLLQQLRQAEYALQNNKLVYKRDKLLKQYVLAWKAVEKQKEAIQAQAELSAYAKYIDELEEGDFDLPFEPSSEPDYEVWDLCAKYGV